jgi:hypothetical protein
MNATEVFRLWQDAEARRWVEAHEGVWNHEDWLALREELRRRGLNGPEFDEVARGLERRKVEYGNLRRWRESGEPWRWVEAHGGAWGHHDWMTLLAGLQCWLGPLDTEAVGRTLESVKGQFWALQRWIASGAPARWVEEHGGQWNHADWQELLESLARSEYGALPAEGVGRALEESKRAWWNLRRWEDSGEPYRWVEAHRGRWNHSDWLRLLAGLERSEFWPLAPEVVGAALERARRSYEGLQRWMLSGAPRLWVAMRGGQWTPADLNDLGVVLERTERIRVEPQALSELLERLKEEYWNLRGWLERTPDVIRRGSLAGTPEGALLVAGRWERGAWREGQGLRAA